MTKIHVCQMSFICCDKESTQNAEAAKLQPKNGDSERRAASSDISELFLSSRPPGFIFDKCSRIPVIP